MLETTGLLRLEGTILTGGFTVEGAESSLLPGGRKGFPKRPYITFLCKINLRK
jgi:hypothetical protein